MVADIVGSKTNRYYYNEGYNDPGGLCKIIHKSTIAYCLSVV